MVALQHPLAEAYSDMPPTELVECLFACPALSVKYVEVSCKTNHQIHHFERILLRSLRLLSLAEQGRAATAGTDGLGTAPDSVLQRVVDRVLPAHGASQVANRSVWTLVH